MDSFSDINFGVIDNTFFKICMGKLESWPNLGQVPKYKYIYFSALHSKAEVSKVDYLSKAKSPKVHYSMFLKDTVSQRAVILSSW